MAEISKEYLARLQSALGSGGDKSNVGSLLGEIGKEIPIDFDRLLNERKTIEARMPTDEACAEAERILTQVDKQEQERGALRLVLTRVAERARRETKLEEYLDDLIPLESIPFFQEITRRFKAQVGSKELGSYAFGDDMIALHKELFDHANRPLYVLRSLSRGYGHGDKGRCRTSTCTCSRQPREH